MIDSLLKGISTPVLINCYSLIILFVFLFSNHHRNNGIRTKQFTFFQYIVIANILLLVTDAVNWLSMGIPDPACRDIQVISTTIFYALDPLPSFFFICFTDEVLNIENEKQKQLRRWYLIPVVLHFMITLASPFTGWFFQIDAVNEYHRGSLLVLSFVLSFMLMFIAAAKVLRRYLKARKENLEIAKKVTQYGCLLSFTIIPLIGGVLQALDNSITYIWSATVIALLLLYINSQNTEITTDTLTGVYNRRQAFSYLERFIREWERDKDKTTVAVVVLDVNSFKSINDQYGHSIGDEAIIAVARSLETEFHWDDFICRFGGDEFLVITKHGQEADLEAAIDRVNNGLVRLFEQNKFPFVLSLSAGYAVLSRKNNTLDSLFQKADAMMFEQKSKQMRRASDRLS